MVVVELKVGDKVWIHNGGDGNPLTEGNVIMDLDIPGYGRHYIIALPTGIDDLLVIRMPYTVSDHPSKPIGLYRHMNK